MPYKQKTRKSVAKRFKITSSGKVIFRGQGGRHLRRKKSKRVIRGFNVPKVMTGKFAKKIKRALGVA